MLNRNQVEHLKEERKKLFNAWQTASGSNKTSILTRISDIDEDLERYMPKKNKRFRKFTKNNVKLLLND